MRSGDVMTLFCTVRVVKQEAKAIGGTEWGLY